MRAVGKHLVLPGDLSAEWQCVAAESAELSTKWRSERKSDAGVVAVAVVGTSRCAFNFIAATIKLIKEHLVNNNERGPTATTAAAAFLSSLSRIYFSVQPLSLINQCPLAAAAAVAAAAAAAAAAAVVL